MPTKTTKKTLVKKESWKSQIEKSAVKSGNSWDSIKVEKKDASKKGVVKRRKLDLTPTRASAVAIASQANREKKQELIERMQSWTYVPEETNSKPKDDKIPGWVWTFFGCSLLLFCISFYQAIFRPSIEKELINPDTESDFYWVIENTSEWDTNDLEEENVDEWDVSETVDNGGYKIPTTAVETIQEYFNRISNRQFEELFDLFLPVLKNSSEMKNHFTSFRMNPFLDWIEWWRLEPTNFKYISSPAFGRDRYSTDLSYTLISNRQKYEETWEFLIDSKGEEFKSVSVVCSTPKCSYHPIFWPENFGLLR